MKNLIAIFVFLFAFNNTFTLAQSNDQGKDYIIELQSELIHALDQYISVMDNIGTKKAEETKFKKLFADWNSIYMEDLFVDEKTSFHPREYPSILYPTKFAADNESMYSFVKFSFPVVTYYYDNPILFKNTNLTADNLVRSYFAEEYFDKEKKYNEYYYIRTGIEIQYFTARSSNESIQRKDNIMIHWLFNKKSKSNLNDFKIISIHNYDEYTFKNTLPDTPPIKEKKKVEFPEEDKVEAIAKAQKYLKTYFNAFESVPKDRRTQNEFAWKYYSDPTSKVAIDVSMGNKESISAKGYLFKLAGLDSLNQSFELIKMSPEVNYSGNKNYYWVVAQTKAHTSFKSSDSTYIKNEVLLNMVVKFKYEDGIYSEFKINEIKYKHNNPIKSQLFKIKKPNPVVEETPNPPTIENTKPYQLTDEDTTDISSTAWLLANEFLLNCSQYIRGASVDINKFHELFDNPALNTVEVINCWTKDTTAYSIVNYLPHLDSLDYTAKYFVPIKTDTPEEIRFDADRNEWFTHINIEYKFTGINSDKNLKYNDLTVKQIKVVIRKNKSNFDVLLQDILVVENECLSPEHKLDFASKSGKSAE